MEGWKDGFDTHPYYRSSEKNLIFSALCVFTARSAVCFSTGAILWLAVALTPVDVFAQNRATEIDDAIGLYRSGQHAEAAQQLRAMVESPDLEGLTPQMRATVYTYLAMSDGATGNTQAPPASVASAVRADAEVFMTYGRSWAEQHPAVVDTAVSILLHQSIVQYEDAEYAASSDILQAASKLDGFMAPSMMVQIHKYLAFNHVAMRQAQLAREAFEDALWLDPRLDIGDESVIAPKIRREFLAIRRDVLKKSQARARRNTLLRSLLVPGWGQLYRGEHSKGYGFMAAQFAMITGMVLSVSAYNDARNAYIAFDADDALFVYTRNNSITDVHNELDHLFSRYNTKSKQANLFIGLSIGLWGLNIIDAVVLTLRRDGIRIADANRTDDGLSPLALNWDPDLQQWTLTYQIPW